MAYQFLRHDGFVYRRPEPPEDDFLDQDNLDRVEVWNGTEWHALPTYDFRMMPVFYGSVVPEAVAMKMVAGSRQ